MESGLYNGLPDNAATTVHCGNGLTLSWWRFFLIREAGHDVPFQKRDKNIKEGPTEMIELFSPPLSREQKGD